jgi:hypothetical protein
LREFQNERERVLKFDWQNFSDIDVYWENGFTQTRLEGYATPSDYFSDQRFYKKLLIENAPSRIITDDDGNSQRLFYRHKGHVWIGELKKD